MTSLIAPVMLLCAALLPAASLLVFRLAARTASIPSDPLLRALLVVVPLSTFLLGVFLFQSRRQVNCLRAGAMQAGASAGIDPLSRLPNRLFFEALLESALKRGQGTTQTAVFKIEIDRFASINETHGEETGDRLILGITERIKRIIRDRDCLARIGGSTFGLMLADGASLDQCAAMAHRIHDAMLAPFAIDGLVLSAGVSIGIATAPQSGNTGPALITAAGLAVARAKQDGGNRSAFFDQTMEQRLRLSLKIEDELRTAVKTGGLTIFYQPLMAPCGQIMRGVEALVRWQHPELGLISPESFIPLAESRGLIAPLGEWVLRHACADAKRWPGLGIAVNVSPVQFRTPGFVAMVRDAIAESGLDPHRLELELTEGVLIQDADQAEAIILDLRAQGIRMGLDDFGSGYSSMIYLRRFAFDKIKIDRALLNAMEPSGESAIILASIVSLGHALGLTVTAEGIETAEQAAFLRKLGCDELQGYFFSEPVPASVIDTRFQAAGLTAA